MMLYFFCIISSLVIFIFHKKIFSLINIYDYPDNERKIHKIPISLSGSFFIITNIFIFLIFIFFFNDGDYFNVLNKKRDFFFLIFCLSGVYFLGLLDDKFNINPWVKLGVATFFIILIMLSDPTMIIKILYFKFSDIIFQINLENLAILFTLICFVAYLNAINMFDGINLQLGMYIFLVSTYLIFKNIYTELNIILIISLIPFLILNFRNKVFIGNSGTNLIAFIYGYQYIKGYNLGYLEVDIILLLNYLIGLDLIRVFILRISIGKNPFIADRNHIHHILAEKFHQKYVVLITLSLSAFPILLSFYFENNYLLLIFFIFVYLFAVIFLRRFNNSV